MKKEGEGRAARRRDVTCKYCLLTFLYMPIIYISWPLTNPEGRVERMFVKQITKQKTVLVNIFLVSMSFTCAGSLSPI